MNTGCVEDVHTSVQSVYEGVQERVLRRFEVYTACFRVPSGPRPAQVVAVGGDVGCFHMHRTPNGGKTSTVGPYTPFQDGLPPSFDPNLGLDLPLGTLRGVLRRYISPRGTAQGYIRVSYPPLGTPYAPTNTPAHPLDLPSSTEDTYSAVELPPMLYIQCLARIHTALESR